MPQQAPQTCLLDTGRARTVRQASTAWAAGTAHLTTGNALRMFSDEKAGAQPLRTAAHISGSRVVKKLGMLLGL